MKILYKQSEQDKAGSLIRFGVENCYLKQLSLDYDCVTKRPHHHKEFEMHVVTEGYQEYELGGKTYKVEKGNFLLIYPDVVHAVNMSTSHTHKYSITFTRHIDEQRDCFFGLVTQRMLENFAYAASEASREKEISRILIENNILEILVATHRMLGLKEKESNLKQDENAIVILAKQYIVDNIETAPRVADVAEYCYLSAKQLTRIFHRFEGVSPGEYIIDKRVQKIKKLLTDTELSLLQIGEMMHFSSEYYFNAFFKKHAGMPPGEYRKMYDK